MIRRFALASALFVAVGSAAPSMAVADFNNSNLQISSTVSNNCTISTAALSFGTYNPVEGSNVTGTVTTNCTAYVNAVITLGQGFYSATGSSNEVPLRRLQNGASASYLNYNLYKNSGKTTIWGNSTSTGVTVIGTGTEESTSVYGEIPAGQSVAAGSYTDDVTATVTY
ncbi:MAG: spore coat protein U domain-containing protein [Dolichospermum sp. JUN01]|nr:spore coat protein U domain-containing protein [Dolichospermum sp. JUN01]